MKDQIKDQMEALGGALFKTWQGYALLIEIGTTLSYPIAIGIKQGWENPETQTDRDGTTLIGDVGLAETPFDALIEAFIANAAIKSIPTTLYCLLKVREKYKEIRTTQGETLSNPEEPSAAARAQMEGNDERVSQKSKESWFRSPWSKREDPRPSEKTALVAAPKGGADSALRGGDKKSDDETKKQDTVVSSAV